MRRGNWRIALFLGVALAALPRPVASAQTLIAHWKLNESSGTTAADSSGNGRTGTVTGTSTWSAAIIANGFQFNGATKIQATGLLGSPANVTLAAWANLTAIDSFGAEVVSLGDHVFLRLDDGGKLRARYYNGSAWTGLDFTTSYVGTGWHHFVAVFDDTNNMLRLYVDGAEVASGAMASSISYAGLSSDTVIGRNGGGGTSHDFTGTIDDVRVYDGVLPAAEIEEIYSLLLHWKLNETSGSTADDSSYYERDGTVVGTASWVAGRRHNAHDFNGSTKVEYNSLLRNPTSFTLACWARIDSSDTSGADGVSIGDYCHLRLHSVAAGAPQGNFYVGGTTWGTVTGTKSYVGAGWHHFAVTFSDSGNSFKLYVDGALIATTSTTSSISWAGLGTKTRIGANGDVSTAFDLDGAIDDARIYNRALTQSEIADLYGLIGHWKLNETSGTTAVDASGKATNGTFTNGPAVGQAGPYPGAGLYSASFDGTNDYVDVGAVSNYTELKDGFSVAGWVYLNQHVNYAAVLENGTTSESCSLQFSATGQVRVNGRSSGGLQSHISTATVSLSRWSHVVGTYDGTTFRIYLDGQLVSSGANAFTIMTATGNLSLGASLQGTDEHLNGRMHDVRFYNRAIVAEEVVELYGLVGNWKLNEASGTTAADSSGNMLDGTYTSGPILAQAGPYPGAGQYASSFDGSNDYVSGATATNYPLTNSYSIAGWVYLNAHVDNAAMLENGSSTDSCSLAFSSTGQVRFMGRASGGLQSHLTTTTLGLRKWTHVVGTYDGATFRVYIDGQLASSASNAFTLVTPSGVLTLGASLQASDEFFNGRLQDVRLYNRAISAAEIAAIYGLIGHWKFNEGSGTALADSSGAGAGAAFNGGSPDWISGVYGNGLAFDGTSDDAITSSAFSPPTVGTVAYWFRSTGTPSARQRHLGSADNWEVYQDPDGIVRFDLGGNGETGGFKTVSSSTTSGSWYHFAAMYDVADESYAVYLNGVLDKSGVSTTALTPQSTVQLSFGTRTGTTNRLAGSLDDVRVYNRKLSPWEVYQVFGLMAWYKLDETSGTAAIDSTGRGQDGAYSGSPTLNVTANGAASQGTAVAFNGTNYVQASGLYDKSASVSAAAWVRLDGADSGGASVISLGDYFALQLNTSGVNEARAFYYDGSTWTTANVNAVLQNTGWHHFAAVLDAGSTLKLYIDGVEAASAPTSGTITYTGRGSNTRIASHGWNGTTTDFTGRVDDVRVYNRALKPDEVFQLYRGTRINGIKILTWVEAR